MIFCIITVLLAVAVDQLTKYAAVEMLAEIGTFPIIKDIFHFTYIENRGAAFGMLADRRWIFMLLSTLGIIALAGWLIIAKPRSRWMQLAVSLIIGGGIGNMIDRVCLGYVVDFIDCRFIDFYVFNIADSCICVGCALVLICVTVEEVKRIKAEKAAAATAEETAEAAETAEEGEVSAEDASAGETND